MKVYFAGSIRGGRIDANLYERLIKYIQKTDIVLTEHVGNLNLSEEGQTVTVQLTYPYILHIACIYPAYTLSSFCIYQKNNLRYNCPP